MLATLKFYLIRFAIVCIAIALLSDKVSAITVELAKKCNSLTALAFPPKVPGNPAAGSAKGSGKEMQHYFRKCVENEGKMSEPKK